MDSIYSRHRIKLPSYSNNKNKKILKILFVLIIALFTFYSMLKSISPIFDGLCIEKVNNIATIIINEETSNVLNNIDYEKMVYVTKDEEKNTNIVKTDVVLINQIASGIAIKIEERFKNLSREKIKIPLGAIIGSKYLTGSGPDFEIGVIPTGNIITHIKTSFEEQGINQTIYRIYLELKGNVSILTPYKTIDTQIINQVLLVETVIMGDVPETYYNLKGMDTDTAIDIMN